MLEYGFDFFSPQTKLPITRAYNTPETLGRDRIAGIVGARYFFPSGSLLTIDASTCITYNFLDEENAFLGGAISPGMSTRLRSLHDFTGRLPLLESIRATLYLVVRIQ